MAQFVHRNTAKMLMVLCLLSIATFAAKPKNMGPRFLLDAYPMISIYVSNNKIMCDFDVSKNVYKDSKLLRTEVSWEGVTAAITERDRTASGEWIKANSQRSHILIKEKVVYLDGVSIDMGNTEVEAIYEALPWDGGLFCLGRTYPAKDPAQHKSIKDIFNVTAREIEPLCAIWIDPKARKGTDYWICGKCHSTLLIFPLPKSTQSPSVGKYSGCRLRRRQP